jgi:hypothetical protein
LPVTNCSKLQEQQPLNSSNIVISYWPCPGKERTVGSAKNFWEKKSSNQ